MGKICATTCPSGRTVRGPGSPSWPRVAISVSVRRNWRRCLITGHAPAAHYSLMFGASGLTPFARAALSTQRGATAAKSRINASTSAILSATETWTQACFCSCSTAIAASISSRVEGTTTSAAAGNWNEPWRVSILMLVSPLARVRIFLALSDGVLSPCPPVLTARLSIWRTANIVIILSDCESDYKTERSSTAIGRTCPVTLARRTAVGCTAEVGAVAERA